MQPTVSVVMPIYNEAAYIRETAASLQKQDYPAELTEWVFVDGSSTDGTEALLRQCVAGRENVQILHNPAREIPAAMNIGIRAARGTYIVRMDAHTSYDADYISTGIAVILATGADVAGGPMAAEGKTPKQQAIAAAMHSVFALGGHKDHSDAYEGDAPAVYYGIYKRQLALDIGLYNETLLKSEDDDFFYRVRKAGGRIYLTPRIRMTYYPRQDFSALWKQYFAFGYWKTAFLQTHGEPVSVTQLVPGAFAAFLALGAVLSVWAPFRYVYGGVLALYLLLDLLFSLKSRKAKGISQKAMLFWAHIVIHLAYGLGTWRRLLSPGPQKEKKSEKSS